MRERPTAGNEARFHEPGVEAVTGVDRVVARAAAWVRGGGILAHPTETVYGLGGRPTEDVDRAVAAAKGRGADRPLLRVAASREAAERLFPAPWPADAAALADAFWPGPLTLVLPGGTESGVAVRVDGHPVLGRLLAAIGGTMTSTSLNRSGEPPIRTAHRAREWVDASAAAGHRVALLEAGDLTPSPPSTIVSVVGPTPTLVREGAIPWSRIQAALGPTESTGTSSK